MGYIICKQVLYSMCPPKLIGLFIGISVKMLRDVECVGTREMVKTMSNIVLAQQLVRFSVTSYRSGKWYGI